MAKIVAFDIGGTNSRALIAEVGGSAQREPQQASEAPFSARVTSKDELLGFVAEVLQSAGDPVAATLAFAGPVVDGERVRMTNWGEGVRVELSDLIGAGLPADRTEMMNDVVAGAHGLLDSLARGESHRFKVLSSPSGELPDPACGNLAYVTPGTGLGASALVRTDPSGARHVAVGCEVQHTPVPVFSPDVAMLIVRLRDALGRAPTWEDIVSGTGLARLYEIARQDGRLVAPRPAAITDAAGISRAAIEGGDTAAHRALDVYYRCVGRFCQIMALAFLPCAGVFLGGATTTENLSYLMRGGIGEEYSANEVHADLLASTPLVTVRGNVNLEGALSRASSMARAAP